MLAYLSQGGVILDIFVGQTRSLNYYGSIWGNHYLTSSTNGLKNTDMTDKAQELADKLEEFATYLELDGRDGRAHAYDKAARAIRQKGYVPPNPTRINGVGETIRQTIAGYQYSGSIDELEELKDKYSWYVELKEVKGIGPARAKELNNKFRVEDLDDLILVGKDVEMLSGVGEKTRKNWMDSARDIRDNRKS